MEAEKLYMPDERLRTINAWQRRKLREQEEEIEELQKELAWARTQLRQQQQTGRSRPREAGGAGGTAPRSSPAPTHRIGPHRAPHSGIRRGRQKTIWRPGDNPSPQDARENTSFPLSSIGLVAGKKDSVENPPVPLGNFR